MANEQLVADGGPPAVRLTGITKRFGDLLANDDVHLDVGRGEVHALLGENGAGKTTLMRILYGLTHADSGTIEVDGQPVTVRSPKDAIAAGVGMVTQHFSLVRPMTVAENLALGRSSGVGRLDLDAARAAVRQASERYGVAVDPDARVADLSIGQQQRVEILKALSRDCRVLILDEPTAVLVPQEVDALFAALERLVADGLAIIFISHKLHEVRAISDRVSVLRRGRLIGTVPGATDERELASMMVGRPLAGLARPAPVATAGAAPVLSVEGVSAAGAHGLQALRDVSFAIRGGEILGVVGVSGNGQTELAEVLSGMRRPTAGRVLVEGADLAGASPSAVMAAGVGRIPEDRHASLVLDLPVSMNLILEHIDDFRGRGGLDDRRILAHANELIARFAIKARAGDRVGTLSGGNIQKVLLARVLSRDPKVVVVAQPTRGLDVGATEYVRGELLARRAAGAAILLISEDLDELLALSDRLMVLYEGRVMATLPADGADPEHLGLLMAGREAAA
jgi:simple sugar transport system ATP-binding protein